MVFNTNQAFKLISFTWGDYDPRSKTFKRSGFFGTIIPYLWNRFFWTLLITYIIRLLVLAAISPSQQGTLPYYLCDFASAVEGKPHRIMIMIGPLYNLWTGSCVYIFQQMMSKENKRFRYWLRYFQMPTTRAPFDLQLVGYSEEKLAKFWEFSSRVQSIVLRSTLYAGIFAMSLCLTAHVITMQKFSYLHSTMVFWTILMVNYFSLVLNGTMNFLVLIGSSCYLYLNVRILEERFTHVIKQFEKFAQRGKRVAPFKIDRRLQEFHILIDELNKCNFFWSKIVMVNYYLALAICCIELLVGLFSEDHMMRAVCALFFVMTYFPSLIICSFVCGNLHLKIKKAYQPMTCLLNNRQIRLRTAIRIVRALDFINSEHAGIRCGSLFLVRRELTLNLFLE